MMTYKQNNMKPDISYLDWLLGRINLPGFLVISNIAFNIEFISLISGDENRIGDCLELRSQYKLDVSESEGIPWFYLNSDIFPEYVTVLEVLVIVSTHMYNTMYGERLSHENSMSYWYSTLLTNLGIVGGNTSIRTTNVSDIDVIFRNFVDRKYGVSGGLFPIPSRYINLRPALDTNREIWYQMMDWLTVKYDI